MSEAGPLWRPSAAAIEAAPLTAFTRAPRCAPAAAWRPTASCMPGRSPTGRRSGTFVGIRRRHRRARQPQPGGRRADAGRLLLPDARLNFAENLLRTDRRGRRHRLSRRGQGRARAHLGRAAGAGVAAAAGVARGRRQAGRPRRGDAAQHAGDDRRACWPPPRSARSGRPARPISASAGVLDRFGQIEPGAVHVPATATGTTARRFDVADKVAGGRCRELPSVERRHRGRLSRRRAADAAAASPERRRPRRGFVAVSRRKPLRFRAAAVRPPALHSVFVGHDRHSEMHRPFAPAGRCSSISRSIVCTATCSAGDRAVLLHHLRLDDVELAGFGPGVRGDAAAL